MSESVGNESFVLFGCLCTHQTPNKPPQALANDQITLIYDDQTSQLHRLVMYILYGVGLKRTF